MNQEFAKLFEVDSEDHGVYQVLFTILPSKEGFEIRGTTQINDLVLTSILKVHSKPGDSDYRTPHQVFQEFDQEEAEQFWSNMVISVTKQNEKGSKGPSLVQ